MGFFSFAVLCTIAYLIWRISDQLPDLLFRISEIQRDLAELRRKVNEGSSTASKTRAKKAPAKKKPAPKKDTTAESAED